MNEKWQSEKLTSKTLTEFNTFFLFSKWVKWILTSAKIDMSPKKINLTELANLIII